MIPIVLQPGLFGFSQFKLGKLQLSYFHKIDRALERRGHPLIVSKVTPAAPIRIRAAQLKRTILEQAAMHGTRERVLIIAHSMGGLDARYMISRLGMADRVAALITIATPHRGSPYADWSLHNLGKRMGGLKLMKLLALDVRGISDLTTESCTRFNDRVGDHPDVEYYSISGARHWKKLPPFFLHSYKIIHAAEGENDGLVSIKSAQWGEHVETWPADHLHMINKRFVRIRDRTGDIVPYYLKMLERVLKNSSTENTEGTENTEFKI